MNTGRVRVEVGTAASQQRAQRRHPTFDNSRSTQLMANLRAPAEAVMAETRGTRAGSRRKTPTPQPEKAPARASRRLRSASRDIEPIVELQKPGREGTRQASATRSDGEDASLKSRRTKRKPAKEAAGGW